MEGLLHLQEVALTQAFGFRDLDRKVFVPAHPTLLEVLNHSIMVLLEQ